MAQEKSKNITYVKVLLVVCVLLLGYIVFQLSRDKSPKTELDCLQLGSNERAKACLELIKKSKTSENKFPVSSLSVVNPNAQDTGYCIEVSGTIKNDYSQPATKIGLRIDFSKNKGGGQFHYEVFSPFTNASEQVQPNSQKSFKTCLNQNTYSIVKGINGWYYGLIPFEAVVYK